MLLSRGGYVNKSLDCTELRADSGSKRKDGWMTRIRCTMKAEYSLPVSLCKKCVPKSWQAPKRLPECSSKKGRNLVGRPCSLFCAEKPKYIHPWSPLTNHQSNPTAINPLKTTLIDHLCSPQARKRPCTNRPRRPAPCAGCAVSMLCSQIPEWSAVAWAKALRGQSWCSALGALNTLEKQWVQIDVASWKEGVNFLVGHHWKNHCCAFPVRMPA